MAGIWQLQEEELSETPVRVSCSPDCSNRSFIFVTLRREVPDPLDIFFSASFVGRSLPTRASPVVSAATWSSLCLPGKRSIILTYTVRPTGTAEIRVVHVLRQTETPKACVVKILILRYGHQNDVVVDELTETIYSKFRAAWKWIVRTDEETFGPLLQKLRSSSLVIRIKIGSSDTSSCKTPPLCKIISQTAT